MKSGKLTIAEREIPGILKKSLIIAEHSRLSEAVTTQVLIENAQAGDRHALNELCSRYMQRVVVAVRIRLGAKLREKMQSSDIVQQVMLDAFRKVKSFEFRTDGAFLHFLNKLVENRIRDEADRFEAKNREPAREIALDWGRSAQSGNPLEIKDFAARSPSDLAVLGEELGQLEKAMDRLGEKSTEQRDLLVAVKIEGRTYQELAEEQGTSEDAVRMRVKRAMIELTKIFKNLDASG